MKKENIKALKPLKEKEIRRLFEDLNLENKEKIILHNMGLVYYATLQFSNYHRNNEVIVEDINSIGIIGLIKAIDCFDISKGYKFATFAMTVIRNEILMFIRKNKNDIKNISMDFVITTDIEGNELRPTDMLEANIDIEEEVIEKDQLDYIKESLEILKPKPRKIIELRYFTDKPITQRSISRQLKMSQSYVSRVEKKALNDLKIYIEKKENLNAKLRT